MLSLLPIGMTIAACSPALDWREFSPEGSGIVVTMPCRVDRVTRVVCLASGKETMTLMACTAGGDTYSLGFFDVDDPAKVTSRLTDWRQATLGNVQGRMLSAAPIRFSGMTANPEAVRVQFSGRLPDGSALTGQLAYLVRGLRVYQAAVTGPAVSPPAVDTFFAGLRLLP